MSGHPETLLEMARRQVCEGVMRVARQKEIVAALDSDINYRSQAALAREINLMKRHLRAIEDRGRASHRCASSGSADEG